MTFNGNEPRGLRALRISDLGLVLIILIATVLAPAIVNAVAVPVTA